MTRGRSTKCGSSGSQNHGRSKSQSKKNLKCYNCGMRGHLKKDCWQKKGGGNNSCKCNDLLMSWNVVNECVGAWKRKLMLYGFERKLKLMHPLFTISIYL